MSITNNRGGYSFVRGGPPYSAGVVAAEGFVVEHARLAEWLPWRKGFDLIDAHLRAATRPRAALCAIALRSPKPFSFDGFKEFNSGYVDVLKSWDLMVDGINPVARTNVAPEIGPPAEPILYSFAYTVPAIGAPRSFVVSGAGELPEGSIRPEDVVRRGETSPEAIAEKTRFVLGLMEGRMSALGVGWDFATITNLYTVHDVNAILAAEVLPRMARGGRHGVTWHYTRPPIESIEFEMDVRGGCRESVVSPA
jgi:hypothetical protein